MIDLVVKNSKGETVRVVTFDTQAEAEKGLENEKRMSNWERNFTVEYVDRTPPDRSAEIQAREDARVNRRARIKAFDLSRVNSVADLKLIVAELVEQVLNP